MDDLDRLATQHQRDQVRRLHGKLGQRALAAKVGLSWWRLRHLLAAMGLTSGRRGWWSHHRADLVPEGHAGTYTAEDYLRDHAGERSQVRMARELGCSRAAVQQRMHDLNLRLSELRTELTASMVARLVGWSEVWVRNSLRGRTVDGVWRIWPSELRAWMLQDVRRVRWERVAREDIIDAVGLVVGDWGVGDDAIDAGRAAPRLRAGTPLPGPQGPRTSVQGAPYQGPGATPPAGSLRG
jgi:DNA-binding Lrp family transcriptional regulator